jgi:hypothetical protein
MYDIVTHADGGCIADLPPSPERQVQLANVHGLPEVEFGWRRRDRER